MALSNIRSKAAAETRAVIVDFSAKLSTDELLSGTPSVVGYPAGLTLGTPALTTADEDVSARTIASSKGVVFSVAGGTAGTDYTVRVTCGTDGTPAQTLVSSIAFRVN